MVLSKMEMTTQNERGKDMSECNHKWKYLNTWRKHVCQKCQKPMNVVDFSEYANQLEQERSTALAQVAALKREKDELQAQVAEYERLEIMQIEAGARAANLYYEKHGADIGQFDLAQDMVFLMEQNDELQAKVAVLRKGMEFIADTTSHKRAVQLAIRFVATTPSEAAERVNGLVEALEFYEKFEIDIMSDEGEKARKALAAWRGQEN